MHLHVQYTQAARARTLATSTQQLREKETAMKKAEAAKAAPAASAGPSEPSRIITA